MRLYIVANTGKPRVGPALETLLPWLQERVQVVGVDRDADEELSGIQADAILVLGGDGTLLSTARRLRGRQIPVMGVNYGRLGFLASFTPDQLPAHFPALIEGKLPVSRRQVLEASVLPAQVQCDLRNCDQIEQKRRFVATALNDAVVTAGPPFRMIELEVGADGDAGVRYFGDGVIVSTPSGSTAYNVSAGGPIISPNVEAFCITPICPHSLAFRPVVTSSHSSILIVAVRVNPGTTLFCDGQESTNLEVGDKVVIRRRKEDVLLVENPASHEWRTLAEKLHWAISPAHGKS